MWCSTAAVVKWAAHGFEGDKSTVPSEGQQTSAAEAKSAMDQQGAHSSKSSGSTSHKNKWLATEKAYQDSAAKPSNAIDDEEEDKVDHDDKEGEEDEDDGKEDDDESVKVQAALANAAAAKKRKAAKKAEERAAKEAEKSMEGEESETATKEGKESKLAKGEEDKGSKGKEKGGRGKKRLAEDIAGDIALPSPKRGARPPKDTTDNSEPEPRCSARTGKGENHKNYKLVNGKYKGK